MKMDEWIIDNFSFGTEVPQKEEENENEDS